VTALLYTQLPGEDPVERWALLDRDYASPLPQDPSPYPYHFHGDLPGGASIYVAVHQKDNWNYDAAFVRFRISIATGNAPTVAPPTAGTDQCPPVYTITDPYKGAMCVFPFVHSGVTYTSCTTADNAGVLWCATSHAYGTPTIRDDDWGKCPKNATGTECTNVGTGATATSTTVSFGATVSSTTPTMAIGPPPVTATTAASSTASQTNPTAGAGGGASTEDPATLKNGTNSTNDTSAAVGNGGANSTYGSDSGSSNDDGGTLTTATAPPATLDASTGGGGGGSKWVLAVVAIVAVVLLVGCGLLAVVCRRRRQAATASPRSQPAVGLRTALPVTDGGSDAHSNSAASVGSPSGTVAAAGGAATRSSVVPLVANVLYASAADTSLVDNGREGTFYTNDQMVYAEPEYAEPDSTCSVSLVGHPSDAVVYAEPWTNTSDDGNAATDKHTVYAQPHSQTEGFC
jgi:hypothetical protein